MGKEDETKRFIEKDNSIKDEKIIFLKIFNLTHRLILYY